MNAFPPYETGEVWTSLRSPGPQFALVGSFQHEGSWFHEMKQWRAPIESPDEEESK